MSPSAPTFSVCLQRDAGEAGPAQRPREQRRGLSLCSALEAVTEEDFHRHFNTNVLGTILAHSGSRQGFRLRGRQRHQPQHDLEHEPVAEIPPLFRLEKRDRYNHARARPRARRQAYPRQRHRARHDRDRRLRRGRLERRVSENSWASRCQWGGSGQPDDIAQVALFLASDQSAWVTGERISVWGGQR